MYNDDNVKLLNMMLAKTSVYGKRYGGEEKLSGCVFLIQDDDLLKKWNNIWDKVRADIKK